MDSVVNLLIFILSVIGATLGWRTIPGYICFAIAVLAAITLLPGGPW